MNLIASASVSENVAIYTANNHYAIDAEWELRVILQAYYVLMLPSIRVSKSIDKSTAFNVDEAVITYRRIIRNQAFNTTGI